MRAPGGLGWLNVLGRSKPAKVRRGAAGALAATLAAHGALAYPATWTVHGDRGEVLLFGSIHLLPRGVDWRPPALTRALAGAGDLWFELPIDQATEAAAQRLLARRGRLPPGQSLWTRLTPAQGRRVEAAAAATGVSASALAPLRPWMAELVLTLAEGAKVGADASEGVETQVQNAAPPTARRHALERVSQQIAFLSGGEEAEQIASLNETARELVSDPDLYGRTVREWLAGDLAGLRRDDLDPLETVTPAAYRRLIVQRNRRWSRILKGVARRPGATVVVVGAGHLLGPEGLPALLRAQGLAVDGP